MSQLYIFRIAVTFIVYALEAFQKQKYDQKYKKMNKENSDKCITLIIIYILISKVYYINPGKFFRNQILNKNK